MTAKITELSSFKLVYSKNMMALYNRRTLFFNKLNSSDFLGKRIIKKHI